jgi:hypothetical protein
MYVLFSDPWRPLSVASDDAPKRQNSTFELSLIIPHGVHCYVSKER